MGTELTGRLIEKILKWMVIIIITTETKETVNLAKVIKVTEGYSMTTTTPILTNTGRQ